jgi:hypothetical protein
MAARGKAMRVWMRSAIFVGAAFAAMPACAATFVLLPPAGSMSSPRILSDGNGDDLVYVCTSASDIRKGRCSLQKNSQPRRRG